MKPYAQRDNLTCVLLEPEDWETLRDISVVMLKEDKGATEQDQYTDDDINSSDIWEFALNAEDEKKLCVTNDAGTPIALATINWTGIGSEPNVTNFYVLENFRGQGIANLLHEGCLNFLATQTQATHAMCYIEPENNSAIGAVRKAGFEEISKDEKYIYFSRALEDIRLKMTPNLNGRTLDND